MIGRNDQHQQHGSLMEVLYLDMVSLVHYKSRNVIEGSRLVIRGVAEREGPVVYGF